MFKRENGEKETKTEPKILCSNLFEEKTTDTG